MEWEKAVTHILTHTLHYGGGAFEGIRFYKTDRGPAIFRLGEHMERLLYSAGALQMKVPYTKEILIEATIDLISKNGLESGYIRPLIYFGYGKMGLNTDGCPVNVSIAAWPWGSYLGEKPVRVKISEFIRIHPKSTVADAKLCGHYVNSIMASHDIHGKGYDEAILLDFEGKVAEGPGENIFLVKDGELLTPPTGNILPGITRASVMEIAANEGITARESTLTPKDLFNADEAFFTGTAAEVTPISSIDDNIIGDGKGGPITAKIKDIFLKAVTGKEDMYGKWLTYIK